MFPSILVHGINLPVDGGRSVVLDRKDEYKEPEQFVIRANHDVQEESAIQGNRDRVAEVGEKMSACTRYIRH